jgi:hypothetical protein
MHSPPDWYSQALDQLVGRLEEPLTMLMPDAGQSDLAQVKRALWAFIHGMAVSSTCEKMGRLTLEAANLHLQHALDMYLAGLSSHARAHGVQADGRNCRNGGLA